MGETIDFNGKILLGYDGDSYLIINAYRTCTIYDDEEYISIMCYSFINNNFYSLSLDVYKGRIVSISKGQKEEIYLNRHRNWLISRARFHTVNNIKQRWGSKYSSVLDRKNLKHPIQRWAMNELKELEKNPEKYMVWEIDWGS